jgi:hypothetical protein
MMRGLVIETFLPCSGVEARILRARAAAISAGGANLFAAGAIGSRMR